MPNPWQWLRDNIDQVLATALTWAFFISLAACASFFLIDAVVSTYTDWVITAEYKVALSAKMPDEITVALDHTMKQLTAFGLGQNSSYAAHYATIDRLRLRANEIATDPSVSISQRGLYTETMRSLLRKHWDGAERFNPGNHVFFRSTWANGMGISLVALVVFVVGYLKFTDNYWYTNRQYELRNKR